MKTNTLNPARLLKTFAKKIVTGDKPYPRNSRTAPAFLIADDRNFETEENRLIAYSDKTQQLEESHFDNKHSLSSGKLSIQEWNTMFYKHLDHHLQQFGV